MKVGVIDIGSNSVRLMLSEGGKTLSKECVVTALSENMVKSGKLSDSAIARTLAAIAVFNNKAVSCGAEKVYAFATAAVRNAENGIEFKNSVYNRCGIDVEIISGDKEANLGLLGCLKGRDGGIIDVGGASSEICVTEGGKIIYSHSLNLGVVKLTDLCGQDMAYAQKVVEEKIAEYGNVPVSSFYAIGGTADSLAAISLGLSEYQADKVNGYTLSSAELERLRKKLYAMTEKERTEISCLQRGRERVIASGALIIESIVKKIGIDRIIVSEDDNLEGYLIYRQNEKMG